MSAADSMIFESYAQAANVHDVQPVAVEDATPATAADGAIDPPTNASPPQLGESAPVLKRQSSKHAPRPTDDEGKARAQATVLTEIGKTHHLFHDAGADAYAAIPAGEGFIVLAVAGGDYRELLSRDYFRLTGKGANRNAIGDAINTLTAIAKYNGPCEPVFLRVGLSKSGLILDCGDAENRAIEVTAIGWSVVTQAPVRFRRSGKPVALPIPTTANLAPLWKMLNVSEADRPLLLAWLLAALRPRGPYPILTLIGEQGSAKSTATRILKRLTDPSAVPLRAPPKDERDLLVAARASWVLAIDNLSGVDAQLSDAFCRLATGGGLAARKLYTDTDETLVEIQRPMILNGIDELASRPDLAQRCIQIELPVIPDEARCTEQELWAEFDAAAPGIMAALLDGLSRALRDVNTIKLASKPRMADFAQWAAAGLPALGYSSAEFLSRYREKSASAIQDGLETSALARVLRRFIEPREKWQGSKQELLTELGALATDYERNLHGWPRSPKGLTNALRRQGPSLRHIGITFEDHRTEDVRTIILRYDATAGQGAPPCEVAGQASASVICQATGPANDGMTHLTLGQPPGTLGDAK